MLRRRERLVPAAAFLVLAAVGVLVLVLLTTAVSDGRRALEDSVLSEVQANARSQGARLTGQISPIAGFIEQLDLELEVGSAADRAEFQDIADILEDLGVRTGFFVTDASGTVTQGVQIDEAAVGRRLERPGFEEALEQFEAGVPGTWLPMAPGLSTELPTFATVLPISGEGDALRGTFVLESEVAIDSGFNTEIRELGRGDTGELMLIDRLGGVIAASNPSLVGQQLPETDLLTVEPGVDRADGQVRAVADIPAAGWRIAFTQDSDEFDEGLAGPLQQVGLIIVVVFLAVGVVAFVGLARRLQAAREEQERLQRLSETQEEFISIVSHELRTPVAGVLGFLQTTMDHWDAMTDTERFNALRRSASNARRLQGLTRDVLDSQAVESGRMSYAMGDADLAEEVIVAVEAASALYPRLTIDTDLESPHVPVVVDVDRIQQVLTNLLDNAAKVSPPNGTVTVRLRRDGDRATVSVSDQGPGLSSDLQDRVFDKFVRGRDTSVSGTGLGLYITRQILEAHDGDITVETGEAGGATFAFTLPVAAVEVPR
ncbi:MAG TPA: sensor histidine kinase [Acidimicrobiales bacterium]|nr:sensor histidine kinase [Acidimicrobiales bacterium]